MPFNHRLDPDQRLDLRVQPVRHQVKSAVWWDEGDGSVVVEPCEPDALVELDVLKLNRLAWLR